MRYYSIQLSPKLGQPATRTWTSVVNGKFDPGALHVELDLPIYNYDTPAGLGYVRLYGVPLYAISQSNDLNGKAIMVSAGFSKGLPLANPAQAGLLVAGSIQQAFGNWQGTTQTVDLIIGPVTGAIDAPVNLVLNWTKGMPLATALKNTFKAAFPGMQQQISVSPNLVTNSDEVAVHGTTTSFASMIKRISQAAIGGTYPGVSITIRGQTIVAHDGTSQMTPLQIAYTELIGQPTWQDPGTIQFRCPMRADLSVGDVIKLPPGIVTTTAASLSQYRDKSVFQGVFTIKQVRHVGAYRQPDAEAWVSILDAYPASSTTGAS